MLIIIILYLYWFLENRRSTSLKVPFSVLFYATEMIKIKFLSMKSILKPYSLNFKLTSLQQQLLVIIIYLVWFHTYIWILSPPEEARIVVFIIINNNNILLSIKMKYKYVNRATNDYTSRFQHWVPLSWQHLTGQMLSRFTNRSSFYRFY